MLAIDLGDLPTWVGAVASLSAAALAGWAARIAKVSADASKQAVEVAKQTVGAQTRPLLTSLGAPAVDDGHGGVVIRFAVRNDGIGSARIAAYCVRDRLEDPSPECNVGEDLLKDPSDPLKGGYEVPSGGQTEFDVKVAADWFLNAVRRGGDWAFEVAYADVLGTHLTHSRFGVEPDPSGNGWRVSRPVHETTALTAETA